MMKATLNAIALFAVMVLPCASVGFGQGGEFFPLAVPCRALDTRDGVAGSVPPGLKNGQTRFINIVDDPNDPNDPNPCAAVPDNAIAITGNLTAVPAVTGNPAGHLRLYPGDQARPNTSLINFHTSGKPLPNGFVVGLRVDPAESEDPNEANDVAVFCSLPGGGSNEVDIFFDVSGYFVPEIAVAGAPATSARMPVGDRDMSAGDLVFRDRGDRVDGFRLADSSSGKGTFGVALGRAGKDIDTNSGLPTARVALGGTVRVKVDASGGPIQAGDLLTVSSRRPGHAAAAVDEQNQIVIGRALESLSGRTGVIRIMLDN